MQKLKAYFNLDRPYEFDMTDLTALIYTICAIGGIQLLEEFMRAFCTNARMNLHVVQPYGAEVHHAYEAVFKGLARALRCAVAFDPRETGVPSSKGTL